MPLRRSYFFRGDIFFGLIIIILGVIFLLQNIYPDFHFWHFIGKFWPVLLIILGIYIVVNRNYHHRHFHFHPDVHGKFVGDTRLDFSGKEIGEANASQVIGDLTIDLRNSRLKPGVNHLNISAVIGDTDIFVPTTFPLKFSGRTVLGDLRFDRSTDEGLSPKIEHVDDNYESSESKLFITFSGTIGDMTLQRI
jgi:hypothetical protein